MLTLLTTVNARLGLTDTTDDDLISSFIAFFTARAEQDCNRRFARAEDDTWEFPADEIEIRPDRYPIELVIGLDLKTDEQTGWLPQPAARYLVRKGCIVVLNGGQLGNRDQLARLTYTGGYVLPGDTADTGAGQTALPDDLVSAATEQVAYWYQNRSRLGLSTVGGQGGTISQANFDLLPLVKATLANYRRLTL